ncbi:hypothetical protein, partial [Methanosarcina sp. UBA5]|uniref:hypothetical protein n=1 Tax=Methanosarcina sp. UBA5 TaxID=1915593 RepID=UPI0025EDD8C1
TADSTYKYLSKYVYDLKKFKSGTLKGTEVKNLKGKILNIRYVGKLSIEQKEGLLRLEKLADENHIKLNIYKSPWTLRSVKGRKAYDLSETQMGKTSEDYMAKYHKRFNDDIRRLPKTFKILDFVKGGETKISYNNNKRHEVIEDAIGISEKLFCVRSKSVETADSTYKYLSKYVYDLKKFKSGTLKGIEVKNLKGKILNIRYVGKLSTEQKEGLLRLEKLADKNHIKLNIHKFS